MLSCLHSGTFGTNRWIFVHTQLQTLCSPPPHFSKRDLISWIFCYANQLHCMHKRQPLRSWNEIWDFATLVGNIFHCAERSRFSSAIVKMSFSCTKCRKFQSKEKQLSFQNILWSIEGFYVHGKYLWHYSNCYKLSKKLQLKLFLNEKVNEQFHDRDW